MTPDEEKQRAAERALALVEDGMRLGLGTGSTAARFVRLLGERVRGGLQVRGVATSEATARLARELGIPIDELDERELDLAVDGADEIDPQLRLIKGAGGALLREKMVAAAARRLVVIADSRKRVAVLGAAPLPVEVVRFGWAATGRHVAALGGVPELRRGVDGAPLVTDEGHYLFDCRFGAIAQPAELAAALAAIPGVVEHGLFIGLARTALIGAETELHA
jgi:ribose 5-phosphate isomerase A